MIRLFAALDVPPEIGEPLKRRQQGVPRARWHSPDQLHITLRFYGEIAEDVAAELDLALAGAKVEPFDVALEGVGSFGEGHLVRALWAGVAESEPLRRLSARCESAARKVGLRGESRPFRPHVTLAYLRGSPPDRVAAWLSGHALLKSPSWRVGGFGLYSSWLSADGSRYDLERLYPLI